MRLGRKGRKERDGWGALRQVAAHARKGKGSSAGGAGGAPSSSSTARDSMGPSGKQGLTWGQQSSRGSLVFSPPLYSRARQAAAMGKKEHSTARVSSCPGTLVKY